ncbi:ACN9 family protein [Megaselia abdita]
MSGQIHKLTHPQRVKLLYKTILRLHRGLPCGIRELGDNYTKDEFRRHKNCNPMEASVFMTEWTKYTIDLTKQLGLRGKSSGKLGNTLDTNFDDFRDEQIIQLYELMLAAKSEKETD